MIMQKTPQAPNVHQSPTLEGLPKQFVGALRTLFDILDEKRVGFVKLTDIENRWQDDGTKGLPKGVIESLRKVTPPNGLLSFERFCAGLKICLLRNQVEHKKKIGRNGSDAAEPNARPPSAPLLDMDSKTSSSAGRSVDSQWGNSAGTGPGVPRGGAMGHSGGAGGQTVGQQRTLSMPQLPAEPGIGIPIKPPLYGPPKPPRLLHSRTAVGLSGAVDKSEIRSALQNWQIGMMMEEEKQRGPPPLNSAVSSGVGVVGIPLGGGVASGSGGGPPSQGMPPSAVGYPSQPQRPRSIGDGKPSAIEVPSGNAQYKKSNARRREPRRHTLQNGIDYNMLKRMKQIEQEKDVLMQGLDAVDRARDWYLKQISTVQDKMKYLGRMGHTEHRSEAQDERIELQRARILEVNRHLATLTDPGERGGLPLHMNLAVNPQSSHLIARLKQQNHLLTQDVNKKSDRITALEREKASLIRELFHNRSQARQSGQPQEPNAFL